MNILFCRSDLKLAGPAKLMLESALVLKENNHQVFTVTGGGEFKKHFENGSIPHADLPRLRIENRGLLSSLKVILSLRTHIRDNNIEVIHTFNAHSAIVCYLSSLFFFRRIKVVNTVLGNGKEGILKYIPVKYIAVSTSVKDKLLNFGVKPENVSVVYNSIIPENKVLSEKELEDKHLRSKFLNNKKLTFCSIAMFTGKKGHERIINQLAGLPKDFDFEIIFVGDGLTRESCEEMAKQKGLSQKCHFVGSQDDVYQWLDRSDVFIHMPNMETFGMVLIEAMARGLPIIASNVGGIPEVIGKKCGVLNELNAGPDELLHAIKKLEESYVPMSIKARERVLDLFTLNQLAQNYEKIYKEAL